MDGASAWCIGIGHGGRIIPVPRPVVAGNGPKVSFLGLPAAWIEHRRHRLVDCDLARAKDEFAHSQINGLELCSRIPDPECQDGAFDIEALGAKHLPLPI